MTFEDWMVSVYQGQHSFKNPEQALRSAWDAGAAAERNAILQMSRDQWFKTQADFEEAIRARGQG